MRHGLLAARLRRDASVGSVSEANASAGDVHRLAVLDRLYSGDASRRHLQTLRLLDASVRLLIEPRCDS